MERNFTDERKNEVRDVIEASLLRWIQLDLQIERNSEFVSELGLDVASNFAQNYRDRVVEKLQKGLQILEEKYKDANDIDKSYASNHVADAIKSIQSLNTYILRLAEALQPENGGMDAGKAISLNSMWSSYELTFEKIQQNREFAYDVESIVYGLDGTRRNIEWVGIKQQEYVVEAYELLHPKMKEKMNKFLSTGEPNVLTANDITSIKYLAYTAPEPYRTVYLEYVGTYEFACIYDDPDGTVSNYNSDINKISINDASGDLKGDKRGAYMSFFHEGGHAIDYLGNANEHIWFCQEYITYSSVMGKEVSLQEAIYFDVYNNIEEQIRLQESISSDQSVNKILDTFNYDKFFSIKLTPEEQEAREVVLNYFCERLSGEENAAAGDVYGGVTNLIIDSERIYGHRPDDNNTDMYRYWYDMRRRETDNQSRELWAEYFAACMTGDNASLQSIKTNFPEASKVLEEMAIQLKGNINEN